MTQQTPTFSVIIPTHNRPGQLASCLESLARQNYPREHFDVVVVDDGSREPLTALVAPFQPRIDVSLHRQPRTGPAAARNTGTKLARGQFLAFTDDDCEPAPDWLGSLAASFAAAPDHVIGGRTINTLADNPYSRTSQAIVDIVYTYYNSDGFGARFFASNNLAVPAEHFRQLGGFDPSFTTSEDRDFCDRWLRRGLRMAYAPQAVVHHAHVLTLSSFCRQHFHYGRGAFRFHRACAGRGAKQPVPDLDFYRSLLRWRGGGEASGMSQVALLVVWQVANAAGFFWEAMRQQLFTNTSPTDSISGK
ncbi:MAG TPA: glycosyltransferase [Terriglobales bacterium]|nr:glycosyltransferase [Terriglobales bacterium]